MKIIENMRSRSGDTSISGGGFTLIELLIVIALLGALAVGLLAALDPFEQLKKGNDTATRNTAAEVHGASIRFYAIKGQMPWCNASDDTECTNPVSSNLTVLNTGTSTTTPYAALDQIIEAGELKSDFVDLASAVMTQIYVTGTARDTGVEPSISVCFMPNSKSFQSDNNTKYCQDGTEANTTGATCTTECKSKGGSGLCYWCIF